MNKFYLCIFVIFLFFWGKFRQLLPILTNRHLPLLTRGKVYSSCARSVISAVAYVIPWFLFVNHGCYIPKCSSWRVGFENGCCEFFPKVWRSRSMVKGQLNKNWRCMSIVAILVIMTMRCRSYNLIFQICLPKVFVIAKMGMTLTFNFERSRSFS